MMITVLIIFQNYGTKIVTLVNQKPLTQLFAFQNIIKQKKSCLESVIRENMIFPNLNLWLRLAIYLETINSYSTFDRNPEALDEST